MKPINREMFEKERKALIEAWMKNELCSTIAGNESIFQREFRELEDRLIVFLNYEYAWLNGEKITPAMANWFCAVGIRF